MKKIAALLLSLFVLSCSGDDDTPKIPEGTALVAASVKDWERIGQECPDLDASGRANLTITFNGGVPNTGNLVVQSKWKLVDEPATAWKNDEERVIALSNTNLSKSGNTLSIANGYCWGFPNSEVACDFKYEGAGSEPLGLITINISRPQ
jgi:hypothetical protein